jgi:cullin-associated NEDD8-dissociated protein 1
MTCDPTLYTKLIDNLLKELAASKGNNLNARTYIQAIGAICRQAGHRFGEHVEKVMPLIMYYAKVRYFQCLLHA